MAEPFAERRRTQEKIRTQTFLELFFTFEPFKVTLEETRSMLHLVVLPDDFTEYICHVGGFTNLHSMIRSVLVAGGKDAKKGRQAVFFTTVNPMEIRDHWPTEFDLTKPRIAIHRQNLKVYQDTVYWVSLKLLRGTDLRSTRPDQTRSFSTILFLHFASKRWSSGRLEKSYMIRHTSHRVHLQRSH